MSESPVPEIVVINEYGQEITVRVIAGQIMVCHPSIHPKNESQADQHFFRYIPPNFPAEKKDNSEPLLYVDEKTRLAAYDPFAREPLPPKLIRPELPDDGSPQFQLTVSEKLQIENAAAELVDNGDVVMQWFPEQPEVDDDG